VASRGSSKLGGQDGNEVAGEYCFARTRWGHQQCSMFATVCGVHVEVVGSLDTLAAWKQAIQLQRARVVAREAVAPVASGR
jgi:hypothetical protein